MRRVNNDWFIAVGIAILFIAIITFGIFSFKNCYDDHRNELGLGKWTSVHACAG